MSDTAYSSAAAERLLEEFLATREQTDSFRIPDAVGFVRCNLKDAPEERLQRDVENILESREDLFFRREAALCRNRARFFLGTKIKILPSAQEIKDGILFYGARFTSFCSAEVFPDEYVLKDAENGKAFAVRQVRIQLGQAIRCFMLLGRSGMIDHVIADGEDNYEALKHSASPEKTLVTLSAWDLHAFYEKHHFSAGDAVIAEVTDWYKGEFSLSYQSAADFPDQAKYDETLFSLEEGIIRAWEEFQDYLEIPDQLSYAYLFAEEAGHDLRKEAVIAFDEYPSLMRDVAIRRDGPEWLLVPVDELAEPGDGEEEEHDHECSCGHDHHDHECNCGHDHGELSAKDFSASEGKIDSLDELLEDVTAPLGKIEIYAMILDDLSNGQDSFDVFLEKLKDVTGVTFADDAQATAFTNFIEDCWEEASEFFNPVAEDVKRTLRSRLLELDMKRIEWTKAVLADEKKEVPSKAQQEVRHIHGEILHTLSFLNQDISVEDVTESEQLELRIGDLEDAWDRFEEEFS